jgi:hypothetical protein
LIYPSASIVEAFQMNMSINAALPLAAIYPVAIMSLVGWIAIATMSSSWRLKNFYVLACLFSTTPSAAVENATSPEAVYFRLFLVSKLLNP